MFTDPRLRALHDLAAVYRTLVLFYGVNRDGEVWVDLPRYITRSKWMQLRVRQRGREDEMPPPFMSEDVFVGRGVDAKGLPAPGERTHESIVHVQDPKKPFGCNGQRLVLLFAQGILLLALVIPLQ